MSINGTNCTHSISPAEQAEAKFIRSLVAKYGPRMRGATLYRALRYRSRPSFARAIEAGKLSDIHLYPLPAGHGTYARTEDVARHLWRRVQPTWNQTEHTRSNKGATGESSARSETK